MLYSMKIFASFVESNRDKPASQYRELGSLMNVARHAARPIPGATLSGTIVAKTYASGSGRMIWCYMITSAGDLVNFPVFKGKKETGKIYETVLRTPLGSTIEVSFRASRTGKPYCKSFEPTMFPES